MAKFNWKGITKEHVVEAIEKFLAENPKYSAPRSTFLVYDGIKLPAKHIRGMAYRVAYNKEISKEDFAGGMETVRFFKQLGFEMYYTGKKEKHPGNQPVIALPISTNEKAMEEKKPFIITSEEKNNAKKKVDDSDSFDRIKIPSKNVIEQKNALQLILNKIFDGDIVCEKTYPWLKTPSEITGEYVGLVNALTNYRGNTDFIKKNVVLRCDFVCEGQKLIIEYDERQHFSEARKVALQAYPNISINFNKNKWIKACTDIQAKDNQPVNRDEVRAFYDSTRDIEAARHDYKLVRIMHGQIDFEKSEAVNYLESILQFKNMKRKNATAKDKGRMKILLYLQSDEYKNKVGFRKAINVVKKSDADILVFPEFCYVPFINILQNADLCKAQDVDDVYRECIELSKELGKAVIISSCDCFGGIYSVFANAFAEGTETQCKLYIKHTMTEASAFDFNNYQSMSKSLFAPIEYKGYYIGLTICYDCNHAIFSRMYGVQGIDIIINSTGGNVVYDKWYKYNQVRAVENSCYTFVTMGGDGIKDKPNSYVYGFNSKGKKLKPCLLNGSSDAMNVSGGLYVYDLAIDDGGEEPESSINQFRTTNKYKDLEIPVGNVDSLISQSMKIKENLFVYKFKDKHIVFCLTEGDDILKAEKFLPLMYDKELKKYGNRRYILVSRYHHLDREFYRNQLSVVLKVRAMENFCAVVLESDIENNCYQTGKSKTAQVLSADNGVFELDLSRMTGPESIWKTKGMNFKASWRKNYEWLVDELLICKGSSIPLHLDCTKMRS